ncbi:hypothetical protein SRHO_G00332370 [Serrasalmus rhombeus]
MFPAHKARALSSFALERKGAQYERTRLPSVPRGPYQTARGLQEGGEGQRSSCSVFLIGLPRGRNTMSSSENADAEPEQQQEQ